jgi:hypothetical protein
MGGQVGLNDDRSSKKRSTHGHTSDSTVQSLIYQTERLGPKVKSNIKPEVGQSCSIPYHGHASDSTIEKLLYSPMDIDAIPKTHDNDSAQKFNTLTHEQYQQNIVERLKNKKKNELDYHMSYMTKYNENLNSINLKVPKRFKTNDNWDEIFGSVVSKYDTDFDFDYLYDSVLVNKLDKHNCFTKEISDEITDFNKSSTFTFSYINLNEILKKILYKPIELQSFFVNKCLVNYFLNSLKLYDHFQALRCYFLFENGQFTQTLIDYMYTKFFADNNRLINYSTIDFNTLLNLLNINDALINAKTSVKNSIFIDRLAITVDLISLSQKNETDAAHSLLDKTTENTYSKLFNYFECIQLKYSVTWPLNIILTDDCMKIYNQIFVFLLQIKFCVCSLNNVWFSLKNLGKLFRTMVLIDRWAYQKKKTLICANH